MNPFAWPVDSRLMTRTLCLLIATLGLTVSACDQSAPGPKRSDHVAAHAARYHPEVDPRSESASAPSGTQPAEEPAASPRAAPGAPVGRPVLFVNGQTLTVQEILEPIYAELEEQAKTLEMGPYRQELRRAVLREVNMQIDGLLVGQEARLGYTDKQIEVFEKEADRRIKETINDHYDGIHARYEAYLKTMDLAINDVKERAKRQAMVEYFLRDRFQPLLREPPRQQLLRFYEQHLDEFTTPEKAELLLIEAPLDRELSGPIDEATPEQVAAARASAKARLERAREELSSGIEFTAVAKSYCRGIKGPQGGSWGQISPRALKGRWAQAAEVLFSLQEGQVSEVIDRPEWLFLVKCGARSPHRRLGFEQAQAGIIERVKQEQFERLTTEYMLNLRGKATVDHLAEFVQACEAAAPRPAPRRAADPQPAEG